MKKTSFKKIILLLGMTVGLSAGLLAAGKPVFADGAEATTEDDINYSGQIDIITGEPIGKDGEVQADTVVVSGNSVYDRDSGMFAYQAGGATILCSVADGMVTTKKVSLSMEGEANIAVYHDGESMTEIPAELDEFGSYSVVTWTDNAQTRVLAFQIVNSVTGKLYSYVMPDGFQLKKVYFNEEEIGSSQGAVDMTREGAYLIEYSCLANGLDYALEVTVDHTPPAVTFSNLDEYNDARGPVTIGGLEEGDSVKITFNEEEVVKLNDDNQVTETGTYNVVVTDKAGNAVEKSFRILLYLNLNATLFLLAILLIILGVSIALLIARKKLRVR